MLDVYALREDVNSHIIRAIFPSLYNYFLTTILIQCLTHFLA